MAYVSENLTHFVGRSLPSDEQRYTLLKKIIRSGKLIHPFHTGRRDPIFQVKMSPAPVGSVPLSDCTGLDYSSYPNTLHDVNCKLSDNALVQFEIVCFCDIPEDELSIHCQKYGCFGLAFTKDFLISKGASPVMYIPKPGWIKLSLRSHDHKTGKFDKNVDAIGSRAAAIDKTFEFHNKLMYTHYMSLQAQMTEAFHQKKSVDPVCKVEKELQDALLYQVQIETLLFGYLKFFDPTLSLNDPYNYYMEREWRVAGRVNFAAEDIAKMYVTSDFQDQAHIDFPDLSNRVTVLSV